MQLHRQKEVNQQLTEYVATVTQPWAAIRRRFMRRGVLTPLQLVLDPLATPTLWLVPEIMGKNLVWLEPLSRALRVVETRRLFPLLIRGESVPEDVVHQALHDVVCGLKRRDVPTGRSSLLTKVGGSFEAQNRGGAGFPSF
jgi:hypothetical protein